MAEEAQYSSGPDSAPSNKRKYEDDGGARRSTGFSAPASQSPDSGNKPPLSYNNVPPPMSDFELARQRAKEIAARLFLGAEAKRHKSENGGTTGLDSLESGAGQKPLVSSVPPPSYGYQGSKKIDIPNGKVGVIIGKGGETIKYLQAQSGARIQVTRDAEADPYSPTRSVELMGTPDEIEKAEKLIQDVLAEAETGGSGTVSRRVSGQQPGADQYVSKIPNNKVGLVIGKGGETIKNMQNVSGARIQVIPLHLPPGDLSTERTLQIDGTTEQIEAAKQMVNEVIGENRARNPSMGGGGYNQQGYQARPPTSSWAPPAPPMQQPGYGYMQPGAYATGQPAQYNASQPQYPGYPPQPASGGYATGWDQTTGASNQQPTSQGYDNSVYGYSQPPASGYNQQSQGYPQGGYGFGQLQTNPTQGYEQQQVYGSTPGYGGGSNPNMEGNPSSYGGAQGDTGQAPPPVQTAAASQQGYGSSTQQHSPNPASNPTQPSYAAPTSQPGYGAYPPPSGYGPSYGPPQPAPAQYAPPGSGSYRGAPPASYGAAATQPGYGAPPPYGAPPVTQLPGYGQQQPPPYSSSYGGGYSQVPAYAADNIAAPPTSQPVPPSGVAKASPQS